MKHTDIKKLDQIQTRHVWDVAEYCRRSGLHKTEERRLIRVLGKFASSHELQMNVIRPQTRVR
ncbi:hypothetical protein [Sinorhizobium alkalisoli]|uniref:Uncharacterized protein n=1 Tax=Sinorhizobium alkalisoli TaxID=1752398 RepID=A0A1E3VAK4_9HYPH|nr:hypothetical protein [Sinorhizobium alkalisoli]MCA1492488.1 hypothetical protein [Ensifer sp. NBAIM29]ODR90642.1 hypothetical protein A8M32_15105 [Sinorhizobium alkalisoli]QFI67533.1 hypothetical protein EKH55_2659 [Sinorhizobium alkalisoli]